MSVGTLQTASCCSVEQKTGKQNFCPGHQPLPQNSLPSLTIQSMETVKNHLKTLSLHYVFTTCRYACSIDVPDSGELIVTGLGGSRRRSRVQVYSIKGAKQRLPDLQQPRKHHACSYYYDDRNEMVDLVVDRIDTISMPWYT